MCKFADQEGKEVMVIFQNGTEWSGVVVGCDPDVGITIVDKNDKDTYLLCAHGMSSPVLKKRSEEWDIDVEDLRLDVEDILNEVMKGIDEGIIFFDQFDNVGTEASADTCSFA